MSEYLSSFIIEPVVRQARRLSRLSSGEDSPGFLPVVPESVRTWYPSRLWASSPPASIGEDDQEGACSDSVAEAHGQWAPQIPSPPLEPMESAPAVENTADAADDNGVSVFPPLDVQTAQLPQPPRLESLRGDSDTSLNPLRELPDRARFFEDGTRAHSQSDPTTALLGVAAALATSGARHSPVEGGATNDDAEGYNRSRDGSNILPEDDGMGPLRQKINMVWRGSGTPSEKSQLIHALMMESYNNAQLSTHGLSDSPHGRNGISGKTYPPSTTPSGAELWPGTPISVNSSVDREPSFILTVEDLTPTYAPIDPPEHLMEDEDDHFGLQRKLGCVHYTRNVKKQCNTCKRWYTCRFCHDENEDHTLKRQETQHMLCMLCNTPQRASQTCQNCGVQAACYYCSMCKLWNNDPHKSIYHCDDCGICRLGQGLGKDFFHCKRCCVCMSIGVEDTHKCIERSTKCDCPICGQYMFTSAESVVFMRCGHSIHERCFKQWCMSSYKCPICSKSIVNMESQFSLLNRQIAAQPMPEEYRDTKAYVHCNDCYRKGATMYHWLGLKCIHCDSFNTTQLHLLENNGAPSPSEVPTTSAVTARPELPQNVSDEAVAIPNSAGTSRRPSGALSEAVDASRLPWLAPQTQRALSMSSIASNYFGLDHRESAPAPNSNGSDEDDLDFWGGQSPRRGEVENTADDDEEEEEDEDMSSSDSDEDMEDEEGEEEEVEDHMDIFGHR